MTSQQRVRVYLPDELQRQRSRPDESMLRWARHDGAEIARRRAESLGGKLAGLVGLSSNAVKRDEPLTDAERDTIADREGLFGIERSMARIRKRVWFVDYAVEYPRSRPDEPAYCGDGAEAVRRAGRLD